MTRDGRSQVGGDPGPEGESVRGLVLVSARADDALRRSVAHAQRPRPEYLVIEQVHGMELLDWTALRRSPSVRGPATTIQHVSAALRRLGGVDAVLSDSEHIGLPLALALRGRRRRPRHVMIAHHLTTSAKRRILATPGLKGGIDVIVVHSQAQWDAAVRELGMPEARVTLVPYGVDTTFWSPLEQPEQRLVVSAGREHRDYATLVEALRGTDVPAFIADGSAHSPSAQVAAPDGWPDQVQRGARPPAAVRDLIARAAVVVVPVVETDFPAGITVVLEAMAMGKAVVVTGTSGMRGAIADPAAVVTAAPGDVAGLRRAIDGLLADPNRRRLLGEQARRVAVAHHDVSGFSARLVALMTEARSVP